MENRINVTLAEESKAKVLTSIAAIKSEMPFLILVSEDEKKSIQQIDDGRKPFTEKAYEIATRNSVISPGDDMLENAARDIKLYSDLSAIETELRQVLEMVVDTKQMAGAEAYVVARYVYMKAKLALAMKEPGMQAIVDELGKLFKQSSTADKTNAASKQKPTE